MMKFFFRSILFTSALFLLIRPARIEANSIGPVKIESLFASSHDVAILHILSADEEHYLLSGTTDVSIVVCKAKVIDSFKGVKDGETIFLAPCGETSVGSDYLVFMANAPPLKPVTESGSYGPLNQPRVASDVGYGSMHIIYTCVFDGAVPSQSCDYGVELNPEQVILPKTLTAFPKAEATEVTNYHRWVRKRSIISLLETFRNENQK